MSRPIALLTDYGTEEPYAGMVKGVILGRCPDARIQDITHGVPPHDIHTGAFLLAVAAPYFPPETVFLAVVDPGVGGARRPLCIRSGSRLFVGPDNGLLWPAAAAEQVPEVFHLDRPQYWLPRVSRTFHGRDLFAPIAAMLALNRAADDFGTPILDATRYYLPRPSASEHGMDGEILYVDRFGNAVTNLRPEDLGTPALDSLTFHVGEHPVTGPVTHYAAVPQGQPAVVVDGLGYFEVAVNGGSAADALSLRRGTRVTASPRT